MPDGFLTLHNLPRMLKTMILSVGRDVLHSLERVISVRTQYTVDGEKELAIRGQLPTYEINKSTLIPES